MNSRTHARATHTERHEQLESVDGSCGGARPSQSMRPWAVAACGRKKTVRSVSLRPREMLGQPVLTRTQTESRYSLHENRAAKSATEQIHTHKNNPSAISSGNARTREHSTHAHTHTRTRAERFDSASRLAENPLCARKPAATTTTACAKTPKILNVRSRR